MPNRLTLSIALAWFTWVVYDTVTGGRIGLVTYITVVTIWAGSVAESLKLVKKRLDLQRQHADGVAASVHQLSQLLYMITQQRIRPSAQKKSEGSQESRKH